MLFAFKSYIGWLALFSIMTFHTGTASGQGLAAFMNFRDMFYAFDNGQLIKLEHIPIQNYKVGKWAIAYQKSNGSLMVYENGQKTKLSEIVEEYQLTESLLVYQYNNTLYVYDGYNKTQLSLDCPYYKADKDVVAFYDRIDKMFYLYYKGKFIEIEGALSNDPVRNFKLGDNLLAYLDANDYLRYYYREQRGQIMMAEGRPLYEVDKDIIAYYDPYNSAFKVFQKGQTHQLDMFKPVSFGLGDNRVAYVKNTGDFCVFEDGEEMTLSTITPQFYHVEDSLIVYEEMGYLKAYYDKQIYTLENYIPSRMEYQFNTLAYLNEQRHLVAFSRGEKRTLSFEPVNNFAVYWGLVWYNTGVNTNKVFYNGKVY